MRGKILRVVITLATALALVPPGAAEAGGSASLAAYRGLGAWVDIFDDDSWKNPAAVIDRLKAHDVRTLFLQTTNYRHRGPFFRPGRTERFLDEAAARGIRVVAWYLPDLEDLRRDRLWSLAAIRLETDAGNRFDSFALDIEATVVQDPERRVERLLRLSESIRRGAGDAYPLGAITPAPIRSPGYWPVFPDQEIARIYDVVLPMAYGAFRSFGKQAIHDYTAESIRLVRQRSRNGRVPIHLIGGIADDMDRSESLGFVRAIREHGLIGASLYDEDTSGPEDWEVLEQIEVTPLQKPTMPLALGTHLGPYGNLPGADETHPREVFFRTGGVSGRREVSFEAFDIEADEVLLRVNWRTVEVLDAGVTAAWSAGRITIPDDFLFNRKENLIAFQALGDRPVWGVRNVKLVKASAAGSPSAPVLVERSILV